MTRRRVGGRDIVIQALKRVRTMQPLNAIVTSATRAVLHATGIRSEFAIRHVHRAGRVRAVLPNGRTLHLWSRGDDWVSNQVFWKGWSGYEPEMTSLFFSIAARSRLTLDIGAHVGYYALLASHANPSGSVLAFEPHPLVFPRLQCNVALNRVANVRCVAAAAGERTGTVELYDFPVPGIHTGGSIDDRVIRPDWNVRTWKVPIVRLDEDPEMNGAQRIELMKIDVEGSEPGVLRGMGQRLVRDEPTVFCEVLPDRDNATDLMRLLDPLGYRYYLLTIDGAEQRAQIEPDVRWYNWLFIPRQGRLIACGL